MNQYKRRRANMLAYYPEVARVGNLADALTGAFTAMGSPLTAYSPVPPDEPRWSPFDNHPDAPGKTVLEFARVRQGTRLCQVRIGDFMVPLGAFHLTFFRDVAEDYGALANSVGTVEAFDLGTTANVIRVAFETDADLTEVARGFGVEFQQHRELVVSPTTAKRFIERMLEHLRQRDPEHAQKLAKLFEESKKGWEE